MRGLIPAYAGRTRFLSAHVTPATAHPRLRGADHRILRGMHRGLGSSPLTRGGHGSKPTREPPSGLIPAYAGRTHALALIPFHLAAHPRLRGADPVGYVAGFAHMGSSPLTRGGPLALRRCKAHAGLIPAYAGRTHDVGSFLWRWGAHPRLRGADLDILFHCPELEGSSPLTRGGPARLEEALA